MKSSKRLAAKEIDLIIEEMQQLNDIEDECRLIVSEIIHLLEKSNSDKPNPPLEKALAIVREQLSLRHAISSLTKYLSNRDKTFYKFALELHDNNNVTLEMLKKLNNKIQQADQNDKQSRKDS